MSELLTALLLVSEKAANIARACRQEQHLFDLLVQEKSSAEANPRFVQDFKTLADVLIQETVKHDIGREFPSIADYIKGEENNTFTNKNGETICVEVKDTPVETAKLLEKVLDGDAQAAKLLAVEVHKTVTLKDIHVEKEVPVSVSVDVSELGIWIDPVDSTAEYINGCSIVNEDDIYISGLQCVSVLIGAYNRQTGSPVLGVVNQPFRLQMNRKWIGACFWGISTATTTLCSLSITPSDTQYICISSSEDESIKSKLTSSGYKLIEAAGAGYKFLLVINQIADAYVLSKGSTFKWDSCGPQAILKSQGGGILDYQSVINGKFEEINYLDNKVEKYCNKNGLIAFRNKNILDKIIETLCN